MHVQFLVSSPKKPQGEGLAAATRVNLDGNLTDPAARDTTISPSSIGCRRASKTCLGNSGNSSKNKTPRWANEISPGLGILPPPIKPMWLVMWRGLRKGRLGLIGGSLFNRLETE